MNKTEARLRRAKRGRIKMLELETIRLTVHRTSQHIYAQVISADGRTVLVSASTLDKQIKSKLKSTSNVDAAQVVGKLIARRALDVGIKNVAFDRSGFSYHGRIRALADAAREGGLNF